MVARFGQALFMRSAVAFASMAEMRCCANGTSHEALLSRPHKARAQLLTNTPTPPGHLSCHRQRRAAPCGGLSVWCCRSFCQAIVSAVLPTGEPLACDPLAVSASCSTRAIS
jgi:hypothetical protein